MCMRMTVLASGSKGNSTIVASSSTRIMVDAGLSCRETFKRMKAAGEDPEQLDAVVISHEHSDHINGLQVLAKKLGIPVYMTGPTHNAWYRIVRHEARRKDEEPRDLEKLEFFEADAAFRSATSRSLLSLFRMTRWTRSDSPSSIDGLKIGLVTDLGYMPESVKHHLRGCDGLMIESNHDLEMLRMGRIRGR